MFLKSVIKLQSKKFYFKKLVFLSFLTISLINKPEVISRQIVNKNLENEFKISNISFITKAINKTGASVVTIDSQRFVKKKQ